MTIKIQCQCSRVIAVSDQLAGQPTRCPSCGRRHIVPAVKPAPEPALPRTIELSNCKCRDCQTALAKDAAFCHSCGLPTQPAPIQPPPVQVAMHAPVPSMPPVPMVPPPPPVPPMPHMPPQGPFPSAATRETMGPFARAISKQSRPISGLGRISMTCTYMAIFLGIFSAIFALPLLGGHCHASHDISLQQQYSLLSLLRGMGALTILFTLVGMLTGFLGLFHFGRRRWNAVAGLILSFVIFGFAGSSVAKVNKQIKQIKHDANITCPTSDCEGKSGCCPFSVKKDKQLRTPKQAAALTAPQMSPVPAERIAPKQKQAESAEQTPAPEKAEPNDQKLIPGGENDSEDF